MVINMKDISYKGGVGFLDLLLLAFIILKLCGVISWSWAWVLSPLWGGMILAVILGIVIGIVRAMKE